jgi:D-glycero-beta-D-manno-heptose-7-phosphate kinase
LADKALLKTGEILMEKWAAENLAITLGPQGMFLMSRAGAAARADARAGGVRCERRGGHGHRGMCDGLGGGRGFLESAELANIAAGVVVGKLGTASCTPEELLNHMKGVRE